MGKPFRFIHAADLHIDSPFKGLTYMPDMVREQLLQASFIAFNRLVNLAIEEEVSFIVISGDLFDSSVRSLQAQLFLYKQYEELNKHNIGVYIIHGNHDPMDGERVDFQYPPNVHIFSSEGVTVQPAYHRDGELVAHIYGISYPSKAVYENLSNYYQRQQLEGYHIGLYHGSVGYAAEHEPYAPCSLQDLLDQQLDYVALGHIHKTQILHRDPYVVYAGNIQGRNRKESGAKGCYIVDVSESKQTELRFVSLAPIQWTSITISCSGIFTEQQLLEQIELHVNQLLQEGSINYLLSIVLIGETELHEALQQRHQIEILLDSVRSIFQLEEPWIHVVGIELQTHMPYSVEQLREEEPFIEQLITLSEELQQTNSLDLLNLGKMQELSKSRELYKHLKNIEFKPLQQQIDESVKGILDWLVKSKGREAGQ